MHIISRSPDKGLDRLMHPKPWYHQLPSLSRRKTISNFGTVLDQWWLLEPFGWNFLRGSTQLFFHWKNWDDDPGSTDIWWVAQPRSTKHIIHIPWQVELGPWVFIWHLAPRVWLRSVEGAAWHFDVFTLGTAQHGTRTSGDSKMNRRF